MCLVHPWTGTLSRQLPLSKNCIRAVFVEPPTSEVEILPQCAVKTKSPAQGGASRFHGAPGRIRTSDLMVRSHALYPTELRAQQLVTPYHHTSLWLGSSPYFHVRSFARSEDTLSVFGDGARAHPTELRAQQSILCDNQPLAVDCHASTRIEIWRRERDSNPRWAFDPYTLSRGAPSTSRPSLRCQRFRVDLTPSGLSRTHQGARTPALPLSPVN